jgi:hypothetical protein
MLIPRVLRFALLGALLPAAALAADGGGVAPKPLQISIPAPANANLSAASPTTLANLPPFLLDARVSAYMVAISRSVSPREVEAAVGGVNTSSTPAVAGGQGLPACVNASLKLSSKSAAICSPVPASDLAR